MLNRDGISKTTYGAPVQILANVGLQSSVGVVVDDGVFSALKTANYLKEKNGKKIVPAGTPLYVDLLDRNDDPAVLPTLAHESTGDEDPAVAAIPAVGVLLHDVDVTGGDANGTLLLFGFVKYDAIVGNWTGGTDDYEDLYEDYATVMPAHVTFMN